LLVRLAQGVAVVFTAATFAFICIQLAPGDPATALGEGVPVEVRARVRAIYGYDTPVITQYLRWLGATLQGDLGWSTSQQRPAADVIASALPNSLLLILPAFGLALVVGLALGAWQGVHARSARDRVTSLLLVVLYSIPEFWIALALLLLFSVFLGVLPSGVMTSDLHAYLPPAQQWLDRLRHLLLPMLSVTLFDVAALARFQRNSMQDALGQPFVRTARASGLSPWRVHVSAWKASLLPVISLSGILLPANLAGVVFIEQIFSWPGMGYALLSAINKRDYAVVAACVIVGSAVMTACALLAETLRDIADPRLRSATAGAPEPSRLREVSA
jgi:peptide/nickel transport system permease protein